MEIDNGHNHDDRGVDDNGIVHDDASNDREEAEDDDDEEEITGVARCCSATADFYQLQPSASSLVDDMNTMSMMMTPSSSSPSPSPSTANINNTLESNNPSTANIMQGKAFCKIGLHHPEGSKLLPRDPGGFLRAPALPSSQKGSVSASVGGSARSDNPTLGILHQAHSIIREGKDQSSTAFNGHWNNNSPRRYRTLTSDRSTGTEKQQDEMSTTMRSSIKQSLNDTTKLRGEEVDPPVALAPRFSEPKSDGQDIDHPQELFDWHRQYSFLSSRSASHEATDLQYTHPHHHQGHQGQQGRSPTSTTASQIFLRRSMSNNNPCPSLPIEDDEDENYSGEGDQDMEGETDQLKGSPLIPPIPAENGGLSVIPHATLSRQKSSDTTLRPRAKPVLCRSLAWSQDSQDDRRITKRARTSSGGGMSLLFHPPPSFAFGSGGGGGGEDGELSKQLGSNVVNRAIDAAKKLAAFGTDVPSSTQRTGTFDLDESWASNSSTSGVAQLSAGFGAGRVRRAYGQPIFASTMENNPFSAPQGTQMFTSPSPSQSSQQQSHYHEPSILPSFARPSEDDSSTMILGTKEHREEPSPIHWCQKVNEEQDLVAHVHRMNNANGISSPASMSTTQIVSSHGQCLSQLQQPMLNHGVISLNSHPQGPTSLPGRQETQSTDQSNFEQQSYNQQIQQPASPPVVTAARSSSHYSFDSV